MFNRGAALVLAGATIFGLNAGAARTALGTGVSPVQLTTIRTLGVFLLLALLALVIDRGAFRMPNRPWVTVALGVFGLAALQLCYFVAVDELPLGLALLIEFQGPVLVALWVRLVQKKRGHWSLFAGLGLCLTGLIAVARDLGLQGDLSTLGLGAACFAAIFFASYFLIGEVLDLNLGTMLWSFGAAALAMSLISPPQLGWLKQTVSLQGRFEHLSTPAWAAVVWLVVLGTLVPFALELAGITSIGAGSAALIACVEPVVAIALGWYWFAESLSLFGVIGCLAVLSGVLLAQTANWRPAGNEVGSNP